MSSAHLSPKGLHAYVVYFFIRFAPVFSAAVALRLLTDSGLLVSMLASAAWVFALLSLSGRFFSGQDRIPLPSEATLMALYGGGYLAVFVTAIHVLVACFGLPLPGLNETDELGVTFFGGLMLETFVASLVMLRLYLTEFVQARGFAQWTRRQG